MSVRPLSSALQKIAETELNEVPERVQADLAHIREWLSKQPHLKCRTDDQWLLTFLRCCKFSLQRAKEKLDLFYTMRTLVPEFFANRDPFLPGIQEYLALGVGIPLPNTPDLPEPKIVVLARVRCADPEKLPVTTILKVNTMMIDIVMNEDDVVLAGVHLIMDFQDLHYNYIAQITPNIMKKAFECMQHAYPSRLKGIHCINIPSYFEVVFGLMKPFMTKKTLSRIHIYSEDAYSGLSKIMPRSMIPKEYGGEGDSLEKMAAEWKLKFESYRDWFVEDAAYCSDESKRPGKGKTAADLFGMEGSFRKLDID